jgi:hypothetical protein
MATGGLPPVMALTAADDVVFFAITYPQILPRFLELASHSPHPQARCSLLHTDAPAPPSSSPISSTATPN